ncbi:hypothetical protein CRG98_044708 [Punica granatum]|uniref:C2 NT-type domain-containing protein n=1 Tax=Punica granatum TaxID=22663 RepID=A0A2I0HT39_PUNGR|nr:hypothetical protein CRG98_044708 [Punica granatum]
MFRLHKQKSDKSGERFDFKLSNLQALQVPKGWDKLSVAVVSAETGKAVGKSAKALVCNGNCQWTESFSESVWVPTYDASNDTEGCLLKIVVFMGSSRSGMLGEANINLTNFTSSRTSVPVSLPLKKCSHGTVIQMKVQCLNPKTKIRNEPAKDMTSSPEETNIDYDDIENKSDVSDNLSHMSSGSASSNHMDAQFHSGEIISRETSFSASGSHYGYDPGEGSFARESFSPHRYLNGATSSHIGRQDSASFNASLGYDSPPSRSKNSFNSKTSRLRNSLQNEDLQRSSRTFTGSPLRGSGSSKELIEAVEVTVEEVRAEARMWEKNARKVMVDLENLQKKLSDELDQKEALKLELSASKTECDGLRLEIGELKASLEELNLKQNAKDNIGNLQKELEKEIKFLKESHTNLSIQLEKTQESNIELVSILQEMEETIEKQKKEITDLLAVKPEDEQPCEESRDGGMKQSEPADSMEKHTDEENTGERHLLLEIESLKLKVQELEKDCNELTDENLQLLFKLKELQNLRVWDACSTASVKDSLEDELSGSEKMELESKVRDLKEELSSKNGECSILGEKCAELEVQLQTFRDKVSQLDAEVRESRANADEWEIRFAKLEQQLEEYKNQREIPTVDDAKCSSGSEDLEMMKGTYFVTQSDQHEVILNRLVYMRRLVEREDCQTEVVGGAMGENTILNLDQQLGILHMSLESKLGDLNRELLDKVSEIDKIKAENLLSREETEGLRHRERELETQVGEFEEEKYRLILANEVLERKSSELEVDWNALEAHLSELERENVSLSERICALEAQLRYLTDEKETSRLAMQRSESCCFKLQEDVQKLESEMEAQKADLRGKLSEMQKQLLETKEECGYLRIANRKLEATAESVIEECSLLQKSNTELRAETLELNRNYTVLQAELGESARAFDQLLAEIDILREKYDSVLEETALKERAINAELDALLLENNGINPSKREVAFSISGSEFENRVFMESEAKVLQLMGELSASKQNLDFLMADREKLLRLLEDFKSNEAKIKTDVRRLELKLKRFEYERKHLVEEISTLRDKLQKAELLQIDALNLRRTLDEANFENERLEASFQVLLGDYEETRLERDSFTEKISSMESTVRELEVCKNRKVMLEERVLRLEGDLTAREALYAEDAELKNELARVRRTNNQLQKRVQEYERRAQALKEELKQANGTVRCSVSEESEHTTLQKEEIREEESHTDLRQREASNGPKEDPLLKIQLLKNELVEALEANSMYKEQLKGLLSNGETISLAPTERPTVEESEALESGTTNKVLSLENELRELRESYLHMSLKYAQGEAEREELIMRMKAM